MVYLDNDATGQVISPAEVPSYSMPVEHQILSSSIYQNYRFNDPFRIAKVNNRGNQFVIDEVNKIISFTIRETGPTNSVQKNLHVIVNDMDVNFVSVQHGFMEMRRQIYEKTYISVPNNSILSKFQHSGGVHVQGPANAWDLGTRNWNDDIFIEIHYSGKPPSVLVISLIAQNPSTFRTLVDELTDIAFSGVARLFHLMGESSMYHMSFVNYEVQIPASGSNRNFAVTQREYSYHQNWKRSVHNEFGNGYRVADWNDLVKYQETGGNLSALFRSLGISERESVFVTRNGATHFSNNRAYFASFHRHNKPPNYLAHENLNRYEISLGSWHNDRRILLLRR